MADNPTLTIPKDVLQPIIDAHVSKAISEALGGHARLIEEAVAFALNCKVDTRDGKPSNYDTKVTFLQWIVNNAIREAAQKAVTEQIAADVEHVKKIVTREIKNQRSVLTRQLIENIAKAATDASRFDIKVTVDSVKIDRDRF